MKNEKVTTSSSFFAALNSLKPVFRNTYDALAFVVHACFHKAGFRCVALSEAEANKEEKKLAGYLIIDSHACYHRIYYYRCCIVILLLLSYLLLSLIASRLMR